MVSPVKSFFSHAFALPGTGAGPSETNVNIPAPPTTVPASMPTSKPGGGKKTQQSFFSGAAAAQAAGAAGGGGSTGKTLIGG